jgi:putative colanic acid biosynthesis acetyltransferase WcaF
MLKRLLWVIAGPMFRFSPRVLFRWRAFLLRLFGARIGRHVHVYNTAVIYFPWNLEIDDWSAVGEGVLIYNLGPIKIGKKVTISQRSHLCAGTHDHTDPTMPLLKPPITVEDQAWVCSDAFVGPGVTVGEGAVVGARAVVVKDVEPWDIVAGNPAHSIGKRELHSGD